MGLEIYILESWANYFLILDFLWNYFFKKQLFLVVVQEGQVWLILVQKFRKISLCHSIYKLSDVF